jgi:hypothetical protein
MLPIFFSSGSRFRIGHSWSYAARSMPGSFDGNAQQTSEDLEGRETGPHDDSVKATFAKYIFQTAFSWF